MTAFGFVIFIIGLVIVRLFGSSYRDSWTIPDGVAMVLLSSGLIFMIAGITVWLYRVMP